jgi:hypothetical protein
VIGDRYWSTGITILDVGQGFCRAHLDFYDHGFGQSEASQGTLSTRYASRHLAARLDLLIEDAARLGIEFRHPSIFWPGDGEDRLNPLPEYWRNEIRKQCERLGWRCAY